jgi:hypothetical protein
MAYNLLRETRKKRKEARLIIERYLGGPFSAEFLLQPADQILDQLFQSSSFWDALHRYDILRLQVNQQTILMENIMGLYMNNKRWVGRDNPVWSRELLPTVIGEWQDFLPRSFYFDVGGRNGGRVEFDGETTWDDQNIRPHNNVPVRWSPDGESIAEGEEIEPDDDYLWGSIREHLGKYANGSPLKGLFWRGPKWPEKESADELELQPEEPSAVDQERPSQAGQSSESAEISHSSVSHNRDMIHSIPTTPLLT